MKPARISQVLQIKYPDGSLAWEIGYPASDTAWTLFLATEIWIDKKENLRPGSNIRAANHLMKTKIKVAKNFYRSARESLSAVFFYRSQYIKLMLN